MVIPVVFTFDKRIILGACIAIKSLINCANKDTSYDIRIFHSDLDLKTQKNITKLIDNTTHNISFHFVNSDLFKKAPSNSSSWTDVVYYRFLTSEYLKEYDSAIYSDVDVLFKDDLSKLYQTNISEYELAAVRAEKNTQNVIGHKYFKDNKNEYIFWSGLLLFNCKKFRDEKIFDKLLKNAQKYYNELKFFDLDLMNLTCKKIYPLDLKYCMLQSIYYNKNHTEQSDYKFLKTVYSNDEIINAKNNPIIIHYAGKPGKPWRFKKPYDEYKKIMDEIPKDLRKYTFRDIRKKLTSKV